MFNKDELEFISIVLEKHLAAVSRHTVAADLGETQEFKALCMIRRAQVRDVPILKIVMEGGTIHEIKITEKDYPIPFEVEVVDSDLCEHEENYKKYRVEKMALLGSKLYTNVPYEVVRPLGQ